MGEFLRNLPINSKSSLRRIAIPLGFIITLGTSAIAGSNNDIDYQVSFKGTCNYKFLNRDSFFPCDSIATFTHYKRLTSAFEFTSNNNGAIFVFEGGKDRQPNLDNYFLSIDHVKFGIVKKGKINGVQGLAEGECHILQNDDASEFYDIKCDVYDRKSGVAFNFYLTDIVGFNKGNGETIIRKQLPEPQGPTSSAAGSDSEGKQVVPLVDEGGGVFLVPVLINGVITLNFLIDSGASSVSIPSDVVSTLIRAKTINVETDFTGSETYKLADGSTVPSQTFRIKSLRIGNTVLENVEGSVASEKGDLLLGQSFLRHFKSWSIDNKRKVLILE